MAIDSPVVAEAKPTVPPPDSSAETTAKPRSNCPKWMNRAVWQVGILIVGSLTILAGIVMLVVPGPGMLAIYAGVGILATEFIWAKQIFLKLSAWAKLAYYWVRERIWGTRPGEK